MPRIYLDNQDYSRLYRPPNEKYEALRGLLLDYADRGTATFHFSLWSIYEFLQPSDGKYRADRRSRASFISKICRGHALPYYADDIADRKTYPGIWIPIETVEKVKLDFEVMLNEKLFEKLKNRDQRRRLKNASFRKNAFNQYFVGNAFERSSQVQLGLSNKLVSLAPFSRRFRGEIGDHDLTMALLEMMSDPQYFYEYWDSGNSIENPFRVSILKLADSLRLTINVMRTNYLNIIKLKKSTADGRRRFYDKLRASSLPDSLKRIAAEKFPKPMEVLSIEEMTSEILNTPKLAYLVTYFSKTIADNFNLDTGDFGDLMHLFHTKDVDLMRCDKKMFNIFKNSPYLDNTRLVDSIFALPRLIEKA